MNAIPIHATAAASLTLDEACQQLALAKAEEAAAGATRIRCEQTVLALVGELPAEGTTRRQAGGLQCVITTSIRRTVDADRLAMVAQDITEAVGKRVIRWKPELVTSELRYLQNNEPALYAALATAISAKPAKPSIKLEPAKEAA